MRLHGQDLLHGGGPFRGDGRRWVLDGSGGPQHGPKYARRDIQRHEHLRKQGRRHAATEDAKFLRQRSQQAHFGAATATHQPENTRPLSLGWVGPVHIPQPSTRWNCVTFRSWERLSCTDQSESNKNMTSSQCCDSAWCNVYMQMRDFLFSSMWMYWWWMLENVIEDVLRGEIFCFVCHLLVEPYLAQRTSKVTCMRALCPISGQPRWPWYIHLEDEQAKCWE